MNHLISQLWASIDKKHQIQLYGLLFLMLIASFSEMLSIGAVIPFLAVLTSPEKVFNFSLLKPILNALGFFEPRALLLPFTIFFAIAALFAGFMRLMLILATTRISYAIGSDLSLTIYKKTLYQPYSVHIARNSSVVINAMSTKVDLVIGAIILNGLTFISNAVMIVAILGALFSISFFVTLFTFLSFGFAYLIIVKLIQKRLFINSQVIATESTELIKLLQEAMGGIRDILIGGEQEIYCNAYTKSDKPMRRAQGENHFIGNSPKFIMESFGLLFIAMLSYVLIKQDGGVAKVVPIIGLMGLGAQRLLPMLQQAYSTWVGMLAARGALSDVLLLLNQPIPFGSTKIKSNLVSFNNCIEMKNVCFQYGVNKPLVINRLNLKINRGERIGFIGKTGSGKTTLLDILMGLLEPTSGKIEVDGIAIDSSNVRSWQDRISHVPQTIFLADTTIAQNVAFGQDCLDIDYERLETVLKMAQLTEFIESLPRGVETIVGERGVKFSGGQRQRIGIARALYRNSDVIIFDEATSALDNETEDSVMSVIDQLNKELTILIIAHRLRTLKNCDYVVEITNGEIFTRMTSNEMVQK